MPHVFAHCLFARNQFEWSHRIILFHVSIAALIEEYNEHCHDAHKFIRNYVVLAMWKMRLCISKRKGDIFTKRNFVTQTRLGLFVHNSCVLWCVNAQNHRGKQLKGKSRAQTRTYTRIHAPHTNTHRHHKSIDLGKKASEKPFEPTVLNMKKEGKKVRKAVS